MIAAEWTYGILRMFHHKCLLPNSLYFLVRKKHHEEVRQSRKNLGDGSAHRAKADHEYDISNYIHGPDDEVRVPDLLSPAMRSDKPIVEISQAVKHGSYSNHRCEGRGLKIFA